MSPKLRKAAWIALVVLYVASFPYHPGLRSPNELVRLHATRALVEYHTLQLNEVLRDFGYVGDMSRVGNTFYLSKAPLLSFADVPLYWVMRVIGGAHLYAVKEIPLVFFSRLFLTVLPTLLMLVFLRRYLATYLAPSVADALVITYALGTLAFSYSLLFMSHQTTAVLLFGSFYALWRCGRGDWKERGYLVAGAFAGATIVAEYTGALGVIGLILYAALSFLVHREVPLKARLVGLARAAGLATLGALPLIGFLMWYHTAAFGHPLESGYKHLNEAAYQGWHLGGFLGIRYPDPRAFGLSFFSPLRGFFMLSPFLILAIAGLPMLFRASGTEGAKYQSLLAPEAKASNPRFNPADRAYFYFLVALLLGYAYFTSSFTYDSWGWTTGPRHLTGLVPFMLLPIGVLAERARSSGKPLLSGLVAGFFAASIVVTGAVTFVNYIPDDVTEPVFGLAWPLFRDGYFSPSVFSLLGIPNPASGGFLVVLLLLLAGFSIWCVVAPAGEPAPEKRRAMWMNAGAALAVVIAFLALHAALAKPQPEGAVNFLKQVWLAPPGARPPA